MNGVLGQFVYKPWRPEFFFTLDNMFLTIVKEVVIINVALSVWNGLLINE